MVEYDLLPSADFADYADSLEQRLGHFARSNLRNLCNLRIGLPIGWRRSIAQRCALALGAFDLLIPLHDRSDICAS